MFSRAELTAIAPASPLAVAVVVSYALDALGFGLVPWLTLAIALACAVAVASAGAMAGSAPDCRCW